MRGPIEELRFEQVTWRRGDLPVSEMRRRLGRRLSAQYAILAGWELSEQAAIPPVAAPPPAPAIPATPPPLPVPEPIPPPLPVAAPVRVVAEGVVTPVRPARAEPEPPRPPRFVIPERAAPSARTEEEGATQTGLLERVGWWIGGFLLVAGAVFLVGTVWGWLPGPLRVAAEVSAIMGAAAGLAAAGGALVRREVGAGRGLAAVGLALSVVGAVAVGVEGPSFAGVVGCGLVFAAATGVAGVAARADLTPFPAAAWGAGALLPAVAWLVPTLAWPAVVAALGLLAWALRAAILDRRAARSGPVLGAFVWLVAAVALGAAPVTGAAVFWILAPCAGAAALWVDAARGRWRGVRDASFARAEGVLGAALVLGSTLGLVAATFGAGPVAFVGGALGLSLLTMLAFGHRETWMLRVWALAVLAVPAALLGALGVTGDSGLAGWFFCAVFAVPVLLAALGRLDAGRSGAVVDVIVVGALLSVCGPIQGTPTGLVAGGAWTVAAAWATWRNLRVDALAVTHLLGAAVVASLVWKAGQGVAAVLVAWTVMAAVADAAWSGVAARSGVEGHPAMRLARVGVGLALFQWAVCLPALGFARVVDPLELVLIAAAGLLLLGLRLGHRHREELVGWALTVPILVGVSVVRPLFGLRADPVVGVCAAMGLTAVLGLLLARDRAPFHRFGQPVEGAYPSGWLATPLWRAAQLLWLVVAGFVVFEGALARFPLAIGLVALLVVAAYGQALADRRTGLAGAPALLLEAVGAPIAGALALGLAWWGRWGLVGVGVGLGVAAEVSILAGVRGVRPTGRAQATALGFVALAVGAFVWTVISESAAGIVTELGWIPVPPVAAAAVALVASVPLLTLAVVRRELPWSGLAMLLWFAASAVLLVPVVSSPSDVLVAMALGSLGLSGLGWMVGRVDVDGVVHPALRTAAVVAAAAASGAALVPLLLHPDLARAAATWPPGRALALAAWLGVLSVTRHRWTTFGAGLLVAAELLLLAHGLGLRVSPGLELGAVAVAATVALVFAARGLGVTTLDLTEEDAAAADERGPWARLVGAGATVVALGTLPATAAASAPIAAVLGGPVVASAAAVVWGVAATWASGWVGPVAVSVLSLGVAGGHALDALGVALVAAGAAWAAALLRRVTAPEDRAELAGAVAVQVLIPAAVLMALVALAWGGLRGVPLGSVAAVVAVGALGPVPSGWRAPIATLAPALVAVFAAADATVVDTLLAGGALTLALWSVVSSAPWLLLAQGAAVLAVLGGAVVNDGRWLLGSDPVGSWVWAGTWGGLAIALALRVRRGEGEGFLAGAALSTFAGAAVVGAEVVGGWSAAPLAVLVAATWIEVARRLELPERVATILVASGAALSLVIAVDHRLVAVGTLGLATLVGGLAWWRSPSTLSASTVVGLALAGVVAARLGIPLTMLDALGWIGLGGVAVAGADATARWLPERWTSATEVLRVVAMVLPFVGLALSALAATGLPVPAVFVAAAATWAVSHARFREPASLLLALIAVDLAVVSGLSRAGQWDPTLYVLPFAISTGGLAQLWRTRLPEGVVQGLRWSASGLLYAVAFGRLVTTADNVMVGVVIGLVGLVAGAGLKVRAWIWSGAMFLVAVVGLQAARFGIAHQLGLGVVLSLAGVAVLGGMVGWTLWRRTRGQTPGP